jgi:trimethylamine--corrinoid protein Co-methyltransferase
MTLRPKLQFLEPDLIARVLDEAFQLLLTPGVRVSSPEACDLLAAGGATIADGVAHIPESLARQALTSAPHSFDLYNRQGSSVVHYGGDAVQFDPGSCAVHMLDAESGEHRSSTSQDLIRLVKLTEVLPQFAAQSTAVVCADAPKEIGDLYRLYWVLLYSDKPVVTGAFTAAGLKPMLDLLAAESGGRRVLKERPRAVFDVCPSPPLHWTEFAAVNLIELARAGVPAEIVSMPLAGAAAPVTLIGAVTQHAAECISGITIHQLAAAGAPIIHGCHRNRHDPGCLRSGWTITRPAHSRLPGSFGCKIDRCPGRPGKWYHGSSGCAGGYQHDLRRGHARFFGLPER